MRCIQCARWYPTAPLCRDGVCIVKEGRYMPRGPDDEACERFVPRRGVQV